MVAVETRRGTTAALLVLVSLAFCVRSAREGEHLSPSPCTLALPFALWPPSLIPLGSDLLESARLPDRLRRSSSSPPLGSSSPRARSTTSPSPSLPQVLPLSAPLAIHVWSRSNVSTRSSSTKDCKARVADITWLSWRGQA
ncbi:RHTO0S02e16006g2_1 [Rhodotorula toruloides]|uniref:RHTO0S02e16006g2_1 n=1 Tax=Rhodotorula toruloides TaxID=5286 RepID=A0A061AS47_RHOTO|nr:RHTO0S02e16006g2_1 [Rhodotorula toruloides]